MNKKDAIKQAIANVELEGLVIPEILLKLLNEENIDLDSILRILND